MNAGVEDVRAVEAVGELSESQSRFWLLHQLAGDRGVGSLGFTVRLRGHLDVRALEASIAHAVQIHSSLRTTFFLQDDTPFQRVQRNFEFKLAICDISDLKGDETVQDLIDSEMNRAFDLSNGPLFDAVLYRESDDRHVLLFRVHHIVFDGVSVSILLRDMAHSYAEHHLGNSSRSRKDRLQYLDFCKDWRSSGGETEADQFVPALKAGLEDVPVVLDLPTDFPRPAKLSYNVGVHEFALSKQLIESVTRVAQEADVTVYTVFLAAFSTVLSKWARQDEMLIGVPVSGRAKRSYFDIVGCFVNTIPVHCRFRTDITVRELLRELSGRLTESYARQSLSFERIVEAVAPTRDASRSPLIQAVCNYFKVDVSPWKKLGFDVGFRQFHRPPHGQDVCLSIEASGDDFTAYLEYAVDLFNAASVERMCKHWMTVLQSFENNLAERASVIELVDVDDRAELLSLSYGREVDTSAMPLDRLFAQQVQSTPHAPAIIDSDTELTYQQLDEISNRVANQLRALGAKRGDFVATLLPEGIDVVTAWLAIIKVGAAFIPLDMDWPATRLDGIVAEQKCLIITTSANAASFALPIDRTLIIDGLLTGSDQLEYEANSVDQPLYAIYTSGSTGTPKSVVNTHAGVLNRLDWMTREFGPRAAHRSLKTIRQIFDSSVWQVFWPLINGGAVVLVDIKTMQPVKILKMLRDDDITVVDFVPSLFASYQSSLAESDEDNSFPEGSACFPKLQLVIFGGEEIGRSGVDWFFARSNARVVNLYGPTEASISCIFHEISPGHVGLIPIGRPIDNMAGLILNNDLQLVPIGVPGELCLAGIGLAQGYAHQPALTADRFVPNPFGVGQRLYRTGDLAKRRADGQIIYLGRIDTQIKFNGVRIEPGEIEAGIKRRLAVSDAVVTVRTDKAGTKRLVAYIVSPQAESPRSTAEFRAALQSELPSHLIPSLFVTLDRIPLGPGGKLNVRALPEPEYDAGAEYMPPENPTETRMAKLWSRLLDVSNISRLDNFFDLGGHSLMAIRLTSRIRDEFGVQLSLRDLFENATLSDLSKCVEIAASPHHTPKLISSAQGVDSRRAPISFNQQQLWVLESMGGGGVAYNVSKVLRLKGEIDVSALSLALTEVVRRHESLRTRFDAKAGLAEQVIDQPWPLSLRPRPVAEGELDRVVSELVETPFLLADDRLFRAQLLSLGKQDFVLVLVMHHIVSDGWSVSILLDEMMTLYNNIVSEETVSGGQRAVQYADYAIWQRKAVHSTRVAEQLEFWKRSLDGAPPSIVLPIDKARPTNGENKGSTVSFDIPHSVAASVPQIARSFNTTLYNVLLSSFQLTLSKWSNQTDIVVGSLNAGRTLSEVERTIGYFVNMFALRSDLAQTSSFQDLLSTNTKLLFDISSNLDVTFDQVVEAVNPRRETSRQPIFQVLFALQNMPAFASGMVGLELTEITPRRTTSKLDLSVFVTEKNGKLTAEIEYSTELFEIDTINKFVQRWFCVLEQCTANPGIRIDDIGIVLPDERNMIVNVWAAASPEAESDLCLHDLFTQQAQKHPHAIAISFEGTSLSYRELDRWSDRLAAKLLAGGISQGAIVGLCIERSANLVIGALAILKAGAAYLPLDPSYPEDRLRYMIDDAQVPLIVTDRETRRKVPQTAASLIEIPQPDDLEVPISPSPARVSPEGAAYVIYTSGSTGRPKGVVVSHRNVGRLLSSTQKKFRFNSDDVWTLFHSFSFDFSVWELWGALAFGGRLVIVPFETSRSPDDFVDLLAREQVTVLNQTPSAFGAVSQVILANNVTLPNLRYVIFGGEKLVISSLKKWFNRFGDAIPKLVNMYGITETTVHVTYREITREDVNSNSESVIGRPLPDLQVFILDQGDNLVPIGTPGEMYIAGEGLARGYLNQPALTAARFVPNPFMSSMRLYKTGDLASWRADGDIDYLGRIDQQVKLRGFRIELGEIESTLVALEGVREAAVIVRGQGEEQWLAAYLVGNEQISIDWLRSQLRRSLPDYMVPTTFTFLEQIPLNANGKLDRPSLPAPKAERPVPASTDTWTATQKQLAPIFAATLGSRHIDLHDNFFSVGGHSLLAVRICRQIEIETGKRIPIRELFERPTIAALSSWLDDGTGARQTRFTIPLRPGNGSNEAICFLPTALGTGVYYARIAQKLAGSAAVFSCSLPSVEDDESPLSSVQEIAAHCLNRVVMGQHYERWTLVGWSFGGVLAFEMAQQMASLGLANPKVVLLDSYVASTTRKGDENENSRATQRSAVFEKYIKTAGSMGPTEAGGINGSKEPFWRPEREARYRQVFDHSIAALREYCPQAVVDHLYEIRAKQSVINLGRDDAEIRPLPALKRTVVELDGDHFSIMDEDNPALIQALDGFVL